MTRIVELLDEARELIEEAGGDERDAFDNLPKGIMDSERGERMNEAADSLDEAVSDLENVIELVNTASE